MFQCSVCKKKFNEIKVLGPNRILVFTKQDDRHFIDKNGKQVEVCSKCFKEYEKIEKEGYIRTVDLD